MKKEILKKADILVTEIHDQIKSHKRDTIKKLRAVRDMLCDEDICFIEHKKAR